MATATTTIRNTIAKPSTNTTGKGVEGAKPSNDFLVPYNKGVAMINLGKYNESIAYFDKALAINPKYVGSLDSKGAALFNLGKYNESIAYFDKVLAINPNYFASLYNKGAALNKLGKYNESIAYFDKVLSKEPTNRHALAGKKIDLAALSSTFGFYFGPQPTNATATPPTNAHISECLKKSWFLCFLKKYL
jgi:tetratricopeptide (TPR) repeat protein